MSLMEKFSAEELKNINLTGCLSIGAGLILQAIPMYSILTGIWIIGSFAIPPYFVLIALNIYLLNTTKNTSKIKMGFSFIFILANFYAFFKLLSTTTDFSDGNYSQISMSIKLIRTFGIWGLAFFVVGLILRFVFLVNSTNASSKHK